MGERTAGADSEYLKWAIERQIERIDACDGHVQDLHKRATVVAAAVFAVATFALPALLPLTLLELVVLVLGVTVTGFTWWRVTMVQNTEDYDPAQFTDQVGDFGTPAFLRSVLEHITGVAQGAQAQVHAKGQRYRWNHIAGGLAFFAIIILLSLGAVSREQPQASSASPQSAGQAPEDHSQRPGGSPEVEGRPPNAEAVGHGGKEED